MKYRPFPAAGNQLEEAHRRKMTGEGPTYQKRQKERIKCGDCGKEMAAGSLEAHRMIQYGKVKADKWSWNKADTGGGKQNPIV